MENKVEQIILQKIQDTEYDISTTEIADQTDIHRKTVEKYITSLLGKQKIEKTRQVGSSKMYDTPKP